MKTIEFKDDILDEIRNGNKFWIVGKEKIDCGIYQVSAAEFQVKVIGVAPLKDIISMFREALKKASEKDEFQGLFVDKVTFEMVLDSGKVIAVHLNEVIEEAFEIYGDDIFSNDKEHYTLLFEFMETEGKNES